MTDKYTDFRNVDGSGNNDANPDMGATETQLLRLSDPAYADGLSALSNNDTDNARLVSNTVMDQGDASTTNDNNVSALFTMWGQLLVHDTNLTPDNSGEFLIQQGFLAPVQRSGFDADTGTTDPREQVNIITSWIDASNVYGSDQERADFLRTFEDGLMKTSEGGYLPHNTAGLENPGDNDPENPLFIAGDIRANENAVLTSLHTLWVREHNYWAERFGSENPDWTDEELYQHSRMMVEAEMQSVTYDEWLPLLLGEDALDPYEGYNPNIDASMATEATTAALRIGHTLVTSLVPRINNDGTETDGGALSIHDIFFNNDAVTEEGIDPILRGLMMQDAEKMDAKISDDLRTMLQAPDGQPDLDLAAINIMRGRDHGIDSFVEVRQQISDLMGLDLKPIVDFSDITSDPELAAALELAYGDVSKVDLWVGGLAEDKIEGSMMGATFHYIVMDQFLRLRDGDKYFYEGRLDDDLLAEVKATSLSDVIARNTDSNILQDDAFVAHIRLSGTDGNDTIAADAGTGCPYLIMAGKGNDQVFGSQHDDDIYGQAGDDGLFGKDGDDLLFGGTGNDRLFGGDGDDELYGEAGDDELHGQNGDDVLYGGAGNDRLFGGEGSNALYGGAGNDQLYGKDGDDLMNGGAGDDLIIGGHGDDKVHAGLGNDTVWMGRSHDIVNGGNGDDIVGGGKGDDTVRGGGGNDLVYGDDGNDRLAGNEGNDTLYGGAGDDRLDGGAGDDVLYGGEGHDIFAFRHGNQTDLIKDFRLGEDQIDLRSTGYDSLAELLDDGAMTAINDTQPWLGTQINLGDGDVMTIEWLDINQLSDADFIF